MRVDVLVASRQIYELVPDTPSTRDRIFIENEASRPKIKREVKFRKEKRKFAQFAFLKPKEKKEVFTFGPDILFSLFFSLYACEFWFVEVPDDDDDDDTG